MIKKIIVLILLSVTLFASNQAFNEDIEKHLQKDFYKFGIDYDKASHKIVFSETDMLFKNGKSDISIAFKLIIDDFFPRYVSILLKHSPNVKKVIIKGHASSINRRGKTYREKFELNRVLSQKRANSFFNYAQNLDTKIIKKNIDWIEDKFQARGMSSSALIKDENGKENISASRRIELEVVFYKNIKKIDYELLTIQKTKSKIINISSYIQKLLEENPTLQEQYYLAQSLESEIKIANTSFQPKVTLNVKHTEYSESKPDRFTDTLSQDITIKYNLFNGYKDLQEKKIRESTYKGNEYLKEQIENDLIFSVIETFLSLQKQNEVLKLSRINLKDYDLWIAKEDTKFQNGMTSLKNYAKVQSRDTLQRLNYRELNRQYKDTLSTFNKYLDFKTLDIDNFEQLKPTNKYAQNSNNAYFDLNKYSPFLKEANQNIKIYKEKLEKSKVNFYPTIDLVAKQSILDENYEVLDSVKTEETYFAFEGNLELYSGGKNSADHEKKLFEYRSKIAKKDEVLRDIKYKLDLVFNRLSLEKEKEVLLKTLIEKREDSLLGASYDYKFAKIDANDLLDSVDDLYNAKKLYIENRYNILISQYEMLNNIGVIKNIVLEDKSKDEL